MARFAQMVMQDDGSQRFELNGGVRIIAFVPSGKENSLIALNIRETGTGYGTGTGYAREHMVLNEDEVRAIFNFLGAWLHGGYRG